MSSVNTQQPHHPSQPPTNIQTWKARIDFRAMQWWILASILMLHLILTRANESETPEKQVASNDKNTHRWHNHLYNSVEHYWSYCGRMMWAFDPEKYICCKEYIRPLLGSRYLSRCCGSLTYNRRTHWCCNGKIRRNYLNSMYAKPRCCGRASYNPWNQMCCDEVVVPANKQNSYSISSCCGRNSYNPFKMTCCSGEIQKLVGGFWHTQCCGLQSINTRRQKCCDGEPKSTSDPQNAQCCGKTLIDKKKEKCCNKRQQIVTSIWKRCPTADEISNIK